MRTLLIAICVILYLVIGWLLFVAAVISMGGLKEIPEYNNIRIAILGVILTMIFWPVLIIEGFVRRR